MVFFRRRTERVCKEVKARPQTSDQKPHVLYLQRDQYSLDSKQTCGVRIQVDRYPKPHTLRAARLTFVIQQTSERSQNASKPRPKPTYPKRSQIDVRNAANRQRREDSSWPRFKTTYSIRSEINVPYTAYRQAAQGFK